MSRRTNENRGLLVVLDYPNILEKFAADVLCTNCGHPCQDDVCHHATIILESCKWDQQNVKWPKKYHFKIFEQTSGLSSMYMYLSATMASLSSLYALRTSALWRSVDMLWISKTCSWPIEFIIISKFLNDFYSPVQKIIIKNALVTCSRTVVINLGGIICYHNKIT